MAHYNYLIVGQGIAGTMLSHFLRKKGRRILVADCYNFSSSTNVAAGILNPITGRRLVKTWKADLIFPFAEKTYLELEEMLGEKFYYPKNIVKTLTSEEDISFFMHRSQDPGYEQFILSQGEVVEDQNVTFEITKAGYVDMSKLVSAYRLKLLREKALIECLVQNCDIVFNGDKIFWRDNSFDKVIFCEGHRAVDNPFFSWLPFVLAKGEIIMIYCSDYKKDKILMKDIFVLPLGNGYYKVGSTYQWDNLNENPTEEGKKELTEKLASLLDIPYEIMDHRAGIRPAVKDRKPLIGLHPVHDKIGIFNGFGAKGASLTPYFAKHFVQVLEDGILLDKEVDIRRFS
jgi:glycine/D-amino acid oxidase-like deaminating enzyme